MTKQTPAAARRTSPRNAAPLAVTKTSIVCGTDFSQQAAQAVEVAAAFAKRLDEPLVLVHAMDKDSRTALPAELRDSLCLFEKAHLHEELERLRAAKVEVIEDFRAGKPDAGPCDIVVTHLDPRCQRTAHSTWFPRRLSQRCSTARSKCKRERRLRARERGVAVDA